MPKIKKWIIAALLAFLVETLAFIPLFSFLTRHPPDTSSRIPTILGWYHLFALWFGQYILVIWNPGPRLGPTRLSDSIYWLSVFVFQGLITTPVMFLVLEFVAHVRKLTRPSTGIARGSDLV